MKKLNKTIALFLIFGMALTFNPLQSKAKYKDQSGNLPGTVSDGTVYALAGVAVVGLGVLAYVLIKNSRQNKATGVMEYHKTMETILWENQVVKLAKEQERAVSTPQSTETGRLRPFSVMPQNTLPQQMENAKNTIPADLVFSPLNNQFALGQANGFQVGVRIRF